MYEAVEIDGALICKLLAKTLRELLARSVLQQPSSDLQIVPRAVRCFEALERDTVGIDLYGDTNSDSPLQVLATSKPGGFASTNWLAGSFDRNADWATRSGFAADSRESF